MELVVFVASLKFFFVEGGEQFIVGLALTLYFFAATLFKEAFENETDETKDEKSHKYG